MRILLIGLLLALVSCGNRSPQPAEIDASDICVQCKMAISERRYAAELTDAEGNVLKFDNVDCMVRYAAIHDLQTHAGAWWIMDSEGKEWLDLRQSLLVRSSSIPGPMGSGVLAVKDQASAQALAHRFSGQIIRFEDLWKTVKERP
jgi:copper chaperone NosL